MHTGGRDQVHFLAV